MKTRHSLAAMLTGAIIVVAPAFAVSLPPHIASAVADTSRPAKDSDRDAARKPGEMLVFAKVKSGETVIDLMPGGGYFTRLFSTAVGPKGTVFAVTPKTFVDRRAARAPTAPPLPPPVSSEPGRGNVHEVDGTATSLATTAPADLVWTSENYHDVHIYAGADGVAALNKAVYDALKPGGLYIIADHAAAAGIDEAGIKTLHRIDAATVKKEVLAAGFVADGETSAIANPADPHTLNVFDPAIRGKTDQFVLRFRKPK
jgi:predicted methyltransferase